MLLVAAGIGVGFVLAHGTDAPMPVGLSRHVGSILVLVVVGCLYGLYWSISRMIDR